MCGEWISGPNRMVRLIVFLFLAVATAAPGHAVTAQMQQRKTIVKQRTKKKSSTKSVKSTKSITKDATHVDVPAAPVIHPEDVIPDAIVGQCMACINNPGVCATCNGSGKMRVTTVESGTRYVTCDKCGGLRICPVCHGKSSAAQSQPAHAVIQPATVQQSDLPLTYEPANSTSSLVLNGYSSSVTSYDSPSISYNGKWKDYTTHGTVQELMRYMQSKPGSGGTIIMPKRASMEHSHNGIFLYFVQPVNGAPHELRMRVQYYADAPQNFRELEFDVSGYKFSYRVSNPQRGRSGRYYWEFNDQPVTVADRALIYAIESCSWTQVYYLGATPSAIKHRKTMSDEDLRDIERVITLYRLNGGTF